MRRLNHLFQKYGLPLLLVTFSLLALSYDLTVPLFEKPDELKHFAVIQHIQTQHQLPVVREGVYRPWDQEGTQPPFYHLLAAAAVSWLDISHFSEPARNPHYVDDRSFVWRERGNNNLYLHSPGENWQLDSVIIAARLARWLSIVAGLGTITFTYFLAKTVFSSQNRQPENIQFTDSQQKPFPLSVPNYLPLLAAALVAFLPQFLHVSSAITNDSLSVTLAAAALLLLTLVIKNGGSTGYAVGLGLILGVGAITKLSLLYLAPGIGLVFLLDAGRHRNWPRFISYGLIIGGLALLLCGWWFWRNWQIYGDATALNAHLLYRGGALNPRPSLAQIWQSELVGLELSFWAAFGAGQVLLEPWLYSLLRGLKYLVLIGLVIGWWRAIRKRSSLSVEDRSGLTILFLLALWSLIIFIALLRWMQITPASLGRLLFPTLPALSILAVWALSQFRLPNLPKNISPILRLTVYVSGHSHTLPLLLTLSLFSLALLSPFRTIQAAYAKTPLSSAAELPTDLQPLGLTYAGSLRLHGYRLGQETILPGQWLPVTLYWEAIQPISQNYSAFVHLLDAEGQALAQSNTYPDRGRWPTSQLEPGRVLADQHYVFVPPELEARAPLATRLAFGLFEFDDPSRAAKAVVNAQGQPVEPLRPGPALLPHRWPHFQPDHRLTVIFADQIKLIGFDSIDQKWEPGAQIPLTLYWETLASPGQNFNLFIHLIDPISGEQTAGFDGPPAFPTALWQPGTTLRDARTLTLPPDLPPGRYDLRLGWYDLQSFARLPSPTGDALTLRTVTVTPAK